MSKNPTNGDYPGAAISYPVESPAGDSNTLQAVNPRSFVATHNAAPIAQKSETPAEPTTLISHNRFQEEIKQELQSHATQPIRMAREAIKQIIKALEDKDTIECLRGERARAISNLGSPSHPPYSLVTEDDQPSTAIPLLKTFTTGRGQDRHIYDHIADLRDILRSIATGIEKAGKQDDDKLGKLHEYCAVALDHMPNEEQARNLKAISTNPPRHH